MKLAESVFYDDDLLMDDVGHSFFEFDGPEGVDLTSCFWKLEFYGHAYITP